MAGYEALFDLIDDGWKLVFPTEESARAFSTDYVLRKGKGILASSVMAFDRFALLFYPEADDRKSISEASRAVFSSYAASKLAPHMQYFSAPDYPVMQSRLQPFLNSMLPYLDDALSLPQKNAGAKADLALLRERYEDFLDKTSSYESAFVKPAMPESFTDRYAVIMPVAFPKEEKLVRFLSGCDNVRIIDEVSAPMPEYEVYQNEKSEIRSVFVQIRRLLDNGTTLDEIAITVPGMDRLRPYLEEEAYLFSIPLDFSEGESPSRSSSGSFLVRLQDIYTSDYSLDALKSFMLDSAIPFKEPDKLRAFIKAAVAYSITSAPDRKNDRYMRISPESGSEYYRILRLTLDKLMTEKNPDKILPYIHTLLSGLLAEDEFRGNEEDNAVYSFTMNTLSSFLSDAREAGEAGFGLSEPVFPLFLKYLENVRYVPQDRIKGIRVYPFTADAAVYYRHRFIVALNEADGRRIVKKASFLSDYELSIERDEKDITSYILSLYSAFTGTLHLSASYEIYGGFVLPLSELNPYRKDGVIPPYDPYSAECKREKIGCITRVERTGFERALVSSLRVKERKDDMTYEKKGRKKSLPVTISYTSFNAYRRCPFLYALQYEFGLRNLPQYEADEADHMEIGSRLHSILERYYRENKDNPDVDIPLLFDSEMKMWSEGKTLNSNGSIIDMPSSSKRPTEFLISFLRKRYVPRLAEAVKMMDEISSPIPSWGLEEKIRSEYPENGFILEGRADRIARLSDGNLVIFDYKKGRRFSKDEKAEKAYQFVIYSLLLESEGQGSTEKAYFISLTDGAMSEASLRTEKDPKEELQDAALGMAAGDWHAAPSRTTCEGCQYRALCRRRFSVR